MKLTSKGFEYMARAIGGEQLTFSKVQFGDALIEGEIITPTDDEQFALTALINPRAIDLPITQCRPTGGGTCALTFLVNNASISAGFYIREVGIFAKINDVEVLYAYQHNGTDCDWLPAVSDETWNILMTVAITVDNATNVTAVVDGSLAYVIQTDFYDHINSATPHPNVPQLKSSITGATFLWSSDGDNHLHPISVANLATQILGDTTSVDNLNNRLAQTEANIANLFMQLDAERETALKSNLLLVEDFNDLDCCDFYKVKVPVCVEGVDDLELETDEGIHMGSWYMLSDGIRSEKVQIKAVAKNGNAYVATLYDLIQNTYDLSNTYLYRTTAQVEDGKALGAGDIRSNIYTFGALWQGTTANKAATLTLNTTQNNVDAFELTGDYAFTADGFFTLA